MAEQNGNGNGGGATVASASELGEVAYRGLGGRRPRVLAHGGQYSDRHLVLHDRYIYWTDSSDGTVTRLPKDGGVPLELATGRLHPEAITVAGGWLYWAHHHRIDGGGEIVRMPLEGGDVEVLADRQESALSIAVFEDTVVWTTFGDDDATGTVMMKKIGGGPPVRVASKQKQPRSIAIDADWIYWTCLGTKRPSYFIDGSVMRCPREGGTKRIVMGKDQSMPDSILIDGEWVYWTTSMMIFDPYEPGAILRRRKGEKRTDTVVTWRQQAGILAVDATHVYWLEKYGGALYRIPKEGGEPEQIMAGNGNRMLCSQSLAVDDRCVYWTAHNSQEAGGAIFKMAK